MEIVKSNKDGYNFKQIGLSMHQHFISILFLLDEKEEEREKGKLIFSENIAALV